jgi:hypothetical protein
VSDLVGQGAADKELAHLLFGDAFREWLGFYSNSKFSDAAAQMRFKKFIEPAVTIFGAPNISIDALGYIKDMLDAAKEPIQ